MRVVIGGRTGEFLADAGNKKSDIQTFGISSGAAVTCTRGRGLHPTLVDRFASATTEGFNDWKGMESKVVVRQMRTKAW